MFCGVGSKLGAEQPSSVMSVSGDSVCSLFSFRAEDDALFPIIFALVNDAFESNSFAQGLFISEERALGLGWQIG